MGWRILVTLLILLLMGILGLLAKPAQAAVPAQSSGDPLVLASYYTWFDENSWTYDKLSDLPEAPYVSRDRGVMARHIEQAQQAGIDAFVVAWYGPSGEFNQTEPNLQALLDEAAARNFRIAILFETDSPFFGGVGDASNALRHAYGVHFNHPAYLRVDGRPVLFFWRPTVYGVGTWRDLRNQVDPGYGAIWISEGVDVGYLSVFDGHHLYSNTWNPPTDLSYTNGKFANLVNQARQTGAYKFWVATVMPGYDDVRVRPGSGFAKDREGGAYYERSWQAAMASNPDWIIITSFNEWPEGTYIEPSAAFGRRYLDLTSAWSGQFKSGGGKVIEPSTTVASAPAPALAAASTSETASQPEPDTPTAVIQTPILNLRGGPSTDAPIIDQAVAGTALRVEARHPTDGEWWQVRHAGNSVWIYAPLVELRGPLDQVAVADIERAEQVTVDELQISVAAERQGNGILGEDDPIRTRTAPSPVAEPREVRLYPHLSTHP